MAQPMHAASAMRMVTLPPGCSLVLAFTLGAAGCEEAEYPEFDVESLELAARAADALPPTAPESLWLSALPPAWTDVVEVEATMIGRCRFALGTARDRSRLPPPYTVWLERKPVGGAGAWCSQGYAIAGESYALPFVDIARHPWLPAIVIDYSRKLTPGGASYVHLFIEHRSVRTARVLHRASLAALPPTPGTGVVSSGTLSVDPLGSLTVTGEKYGVIPGEDGAGGHYTAYYEYFLFQPDLMVAPTWVRAY